MSNSNGDAENSTTLTPTASTSTSASAENKDDSAKSQLPRRRAFGKRQPAQTSSSCSSKVASRFNLSIPHPVIAYGSYAAPGSLPASVMTSTSSNNHKAANGSNSASEQHSSSNSSSNGMRDTNNNGNGSAASPAGSTNANGDRLSRTNLYIRGLPATTSDQDLYSMCKQFGKITSTKSILDPDGRCRGYGFVDFEHPEAAERALRELQKQNQQVQFARQQEQDPTNLYVQNLPPGYSEAELERLFARYGAVVSTRILRTQAGQSKGVGFSRMESNEKCELVIRAYNGTVLPGAREPLIVKFADGGQRKRIKQQQAAAAHAAASAAAQLSAAQLAQQQQLAALSAAALTPALVGDLSTYLRAHAALSYNVLTQPVLSRVGLAPLQYSHNGNASSNPSNWSANQSRSQSTAHNEQEQAAAAAAASQYFLHNQSAQSAALIPLNADNALAAQQQLAIAVHNGQQYLAAQAPNVTVANAFGGAVASTAFPTATINAGPNHPLLHSVPLNVAASYYNEY